MPASLAAAAGPDSPPSCRQSMENSLSSPSPDAKRSAVSCLRRSGSMPSRLSASSMSALNAGALSPSPFSVILMALITRSLPPVSTSTVRNERPDLCV